ncbi:ATP-binding cassette domain-containing protein [Halorhodospira neutriphila]|uniref:ABC transporter ATP-binding protein n=1 Tax=Halorhodospira neutriphila TaxID=168379 RepID=A0ABS1E974_9GAMM|nr:ABC transporter ATP-binding protein [Halorhodospira neutriphila]
MSAADPGPAIEIRGLVTRIGGSVIHDRLDLTVRRGEVLGLVGGSGSGKTVLLRTLIGLLRPAGGEVRLLGERLGPDTAPAGLEQRIGVLFQNGALYSSLTLTENVALALTEHARLPGEEAERLAGVMLALTGLPPAAGGRFPAELSGGMVKRAALARALVLCPELLFLDEPTAGLDPIGAAAFDRLLVTLRDALGLTVFLVTHDLDTLYAACDRVAVLAEQRVLAVGTLEEVAAVDHEWVQAYFRGPRGRAAQRAAQP